MTKLSAILASLAIILVPAYSLGSEVVIVRDSHGRIIERHVKSGKVTKVYDAHGKIIRTEKEK